MNNGMISRSVELLVGERSEKGTTEGNRDPFSSPLASTGRRKSRLTRLRATRYAAANENGDANG
jgi:hypothetical protein